MLATTGAGAISRGTTIAAAGISPGIGSAATATGWTAWTTLVERVGRVLAEDSVPDSAAGFFSFPSAMAEVALVVPAAGRVGRSPAQAIAGRVSIRVPVSPLPISVFCLKCGPRSAARDAVAPEDSPAATSGAAPVEVSPCSAAAPLSPNPFPLEANAANSDCHPARKLSAPSAIAGKKV